jgi:hypothetical protein
LWNPCFLFSAVYLTNDRIRELENQIKASIIAVFGKFSLKGWIRVGTVSAFSQGLRTLQLVRTGDQPALQLSRCVVNGLLSSISQMEADKVGKICIIDDPQVNGAVFDVPEDVAEELLKLQANSEIVIHVLKMGISRDVPYM